MLWKSEQLSQRPAQVAEETGHVAIGPIIDEKQLKRIDAIVQDAVLSGATLAAGGASDGRFYQPTVLAGISTRNPAWTDEIFGPVAPVVKFSTIEEAIALANDNEYGLSVSILGDVATAIKIADQIDSGKIHINEQTPTLDARISADVTAGPVGWFAGSRPSSGRERLPAPPVTGVQAYTRGRPQPGGDG